MKPVEELTKTKITFYLLLQILFPFPQRTAILPEGWKLFAYASEWQLSRPTSKFIFLFLSEKKERGYFQYWLGNNLRISEWQSIWEYPHIATPVEVWVCTKRIRRAFVCTLFGVLITSVHVWRQSWVPVFALWDRVCCPSQLRASCLAH